jgi:hypothetical protein
LSANNSQILTQITTKLNKLEDGLTLLKPLLKAGETVLNDLVKGDINQAIADSEAVFNAIDTIRKDSSYPTIKPLLLELGEIGVAEALENGRINTNGASIITGTLKNLVDANVNTPIKQLLKPIIDQLTETLKRNSLSAPIF